MMVEVPIANGMRSRASLGRASGSGGITYGVTRSARTAQEYYGGERWLRTHRGRNARIAHPVSGIARGVYMTTTGPRHSDADLVKWRDEAKVRRNLSAALRTVVIENGRPVSHEPFELDAVVFVLASVVDMPLVGSEEARHRILRDACFRLPTFGRADPSTLRRAIAAGVRRYLSLPTERYRIVLPLNLASVCLERRGSIEVKGLKLEVRSWAELRQSVALDQWLREAHPVTKCDRSVLLGSFTPLETVATGRDHREAFDEAYSAFGLYQSLMNLDQFHRYTVQFGRHEPLGKVRLPPLYGSFADDGSLVNFYYETDLPHRYLVPTVDAAVLRQADRLLREFSRRQEERATLGLVEEAIRRYGRALNTTNWREAFLGLWQVLELLTYEQEGNYSIKEVRGRARVLLRQHPLMCDVLDACYDIRNALVHAGRFRDDGLQDVSMLKAVVENCINGVYGLRRRCPDREHLSVYYQNAPASDHELAVRAKVTGAIRRERASSAKGNGPPR